MDDGQASLDSGSACSTTMDIRGGKYLTFNKKDNTKRSRRQAQVLVVQRTTLKLKERHLSFLSSF